MARTARPSPLLFLVRLAPQLAGPAAGLLLLAGLVSPTIVWANTPSLVQAVSPEQAAQLMAQQPAGLEIVDIRPSNEYADYALPGSLNLDPATVLADETLLTGQAPLLIVDKDGTSAFAVAGQIAPRTSRKVMALTGGLVAWWRAKELDRATSPVQTPDNAAPALKDSGN